MPTKKIPILHGIFLIFLLFLNVSEDKCNYSISTVPGAYKLCADSLEELMGYLIESKYHGLTSIFTLSYYGVVAYQMDTSQDVFDPNCRRLFPLDSTANCWLGDIDFEYMEFEHSTSQEYIMGVK